MFDNIGLADQAGSGFIRILDEWRELGYRKPIVVSDSSSYQFELDLKLAEILSSNDREWLAAIGGPWREEEELALVFARHEGSVDNQTLRNATGQHLFDASQTLRSLRDRTYLVLHGSGRSSRYVLGDAATAQSLLEASTGQTRPNTDHWESSTGYTSPSTDHLDPSTDHLAPDSGDPSWITYRLGQIAAPIAQSGKISAAEVRTTILLLCSVIPLSSDDLVRLLNRRLVTVRRYITALLESGDLERIHPQERHPPQRYRTVKTRSDMPAQLEPR